MLPSRYGWILAFAAIVGAPRVAGAQCGATRSSCSGCHDGARAAAPKADPWHENHLFADICPACHGGRGDTDDTALAHAGLISVLEDANANEACGSCHGSATTALVARYRRARTNERDAGDAAAEGGTTSVSASQPPSPRHPHGEMRANIVWSMVAGTFAAAGIAFVVWNEGARARRPAAPMDLGSH